MLSARETDCEVKRKLRAEILPNWFLKHPKEVKQRVGVIDEDMGNRAFWKTASIMMWL